MIALLKLVPYRWRMAMQHAIVKSYGLAPDSGFYAMLVNNTTEPHYFRDVQIAPRSRLWINLSE